MLRAFIFPGRGSESVGMGLEYAMAYPAARYVFQEVDEALGEDLSRLIFEGPAAKLARPEYADPALLAVSLAGVKALEEQGRIWLSETAAFVAGHGKGEFAALAAVDAISAGDTASLLRTRARVVQAALPEDAGAMCTVSGLGLDKVQALADEAAQGAVCEIARDDAPNWLAVSGERAAVERFIKLAEQNGADQTSLMTGIPPLHCSLMADVVAELDAALAEIDVVPAKLPVVSNVTGYALESADEIRARLAQQVARRIRWRECVEYMQAKGVTDFIEIGHGDDLSKFVTGVDRSLNAVAIEDSQDIEKFLDQFHRETAAKES
ncbi:ACP S-malonyltransferase [Ferruginivarius sediminum]|uniref:Malonyl CoA-acyl carrier protein transacylase n=1 Tax=Ferruginivarius sediminum TaxID=2661937 RepID=A0A369T9M4_9PROT|nr:ACP S-malonyltransferase [Ferruginivarius sediminum]RDD61194.1 ACP S-malonyltransferase [Ferruginivarius sediminum]